MNTGRYIAVEGPIGVGKTSLAHIISEHFNTRLALEHREENQFLADFYRDPSRWALETQLTFLLSRHRQQTEIYQFDLFQQSVVADYIIEKDGIFARLNLNERELQLYYQIARNLINSAPVPDLVIYLKASVERLLTNIRIRDIPYEMFIERGYLENLCISYNNFFTVWEAAPVLVVNTNEIDFIGNSDHQRALLDKIVQLDNGNLKGITEMSID